MKKLLLTFALAGLFLFGCSDVGVNPKVPANSNQTTTSLKKVTDSDNDPSFGQFGMRFMTPLYTNKTINGEEGGTITLKGSWLLGRVSATVTFPQHSFEGTQKIFIMVNPLQASISFYPHIVFNKIVNLDLSFKGLPLRLMGLNQGQVHFYYQSNSGHLTLINNSGLDVNVATGSLEVTNAQLHHFSRYLFAK